MRYIASLLFVAISAVNLHGRAAANLHDRSAAAPIRVLFIGNSLTYANDLPTEVERLSASAGAPIVTEAVTFPDFSLGDHWDKGDALAAIRRGGWHFVVLQQGPSSLPESRAMLIADTRRFDAEIRKAGARTALYQVWPPQSRARFAPDVSKSYAEAAAAVGGLLLPVGDAWQAAFKADPDAKLYGPDAFHPSRDGTLLAARVIVERITGKRMRSRDLGGRKFYPGHGPASRFTNSQISDLFRFNGYGTRHLVDFGARLDRPPAPVRQGTERRGLRAAVPAATAGP